MNSEIHKRLDNVEKRQRAMVQRQDNMAAKLDDIQQKIQSSNNVTDWTTRDNQSDSKERDEVQRLNMVTLEPQDGNLIILDDAQLKGILDNCSDDVMRGRFGKVYTTKKEVPGLGTRVAIKEITCQSKDENELLSTANEMIASRIMHFATVPLSAYIDKDLGDGRRAFYFISPFFENGNLLDCIARDANSPGEFLDKCARKKILYHIASALDYLHTEVPGFRGTILHVDISSNNVVLDKLKNARLIDFGLACELDEKQMDKTCTRQFVIREILTGKPPTYGKKELRKLHTKDIEHDLQSKVWNENDEDVQSLLELSEKCIKSVQKDESNIKSKCLKETLGKMLKSSKKFEEDTKIRKCQNCIVNKPVTGLHAVRPKCGNVISVCASCMRNSHLNPIICPYCNEGTVFPNTGHTFGALLIAGNDPENSNAARALKKEILDIYDVLVSKWPCVIGIREENVQVVTPTSPGENEELIRKFDDAIDALKEKKDLETLIVYFTGHHNGTGFKLGKGNEYITRDYFQNALLKIIQNWNSERARVLAFLDCCNPPRIKDLITNKETNIVQINVCSELKSCVQPENGSLFKTFFIQALTRKSFNKKCYNMTTATEEEEECDMCSISGDFVSVYDLHKYIADHMERHSGLNIIESQQPRKFENGIEAKDAIIAYNVDFAINPTVVFEDEKDEITKICLSPNFFPNISTLKEQIFRSILLDEKIDAKRKFFEFVCKNFPDVFCIRIYHESKTGKELRSMLELSSAMMGKREIIVSYRNVEQIHIGKAMVFGHCGLIKKSITESTHEQAIGMEIRLIKCIDQLDVLLKHLKSKEMEDKDNLMSLEKIRTCFKDVAQIWRHALEQTTDYSKELKIWFPNDFEFIVLELAEIKQD